MDADNKKMRSSMAMGNVINIDQ
jgi:hypothetical protein